MNSTENKVLLDAHLVNAVIQATSEVLHTMASSDAVFKSIQASNDYKPSGDISAVIGILGKTGQGMFALSFPRQLANRLIGRLIGTEESYVTSDECCDGVGELVNMISGHAKANLSNLSGETYKLSLPTVIQGKDHQISSCPKNTPYLAINFEVDTLVFCVQISFKQG
jgi:CheY-specific phosphatase CheX